MSSKSTGRKVIGDAVAMPSMIGKKARHWNPTFYKNIKTHYTHMPERLKHVNRLWNGTLVPQLFDQTLEHNQKMILVLGGCALRYERWKGRMV